MLDKNQEKELREELSALEHEQWMFWAKNILNTENISRERRLRWEQHFIPYHELPESVKDQDRPFAQKTLEVFKKFLEKND